MEVIIKADEAGVAMLAAEFIAETIRRRPRAVLGLATGATPLGTYTELIRMHRDQGLDFSQVVTFNLDEYVGLPENHPQSYRYFMNKNLFDHINIKKENTHLPKGTAQDVEASCLEYEREIDELGGVDLQLLGIGTNGHIAFNEPVSSLGSRTRVKTLTEKTRRDNSRFFASLAEVPRYAITVGIGTIMEARSAILIATGSSKADAIVAAVEGPVTAMCPASALQLHPHMTVVVDRQAGAKLVGEYPSEPQKLVL